MKPIAEPYCPPCLNHRADRRDRNRRRLIYLFAVAGLAYGLHACVGYVRAVDDGVDVVDWVMRER